ncbi:MAG: SurA N-terminal domain-containing protein [bacterium]
MLTKLREKSQGFLILVLFGMLIFVFIFFFGPQAEGFRPGGSQGPAVGEAAKVRGQEITMREVDMVVRRSLDSSDMEDGELGKMRREGALQLVDQVLLEQRARQMGLAVGADEISRFITSDENPDYPYFLDHQKKFDYSRYEAQVGQWLGVSPDQYRRAKERELLVERYLDFLQSQIKVSEAEVRAAFDRAQRSWNVEYVEVAASDFPAGELPTAEEGAAWAAAHADEVQAWFDAHKKDYDREKEIRVRRILVRLARDADDAAKKAAREKIDGLLAKVKAEGADFGEIAKAESEGYYKTYGGDMGWQSPQNTSAPDYELYASLAPGQISEVRESPIGLWFVKAEEVKPAVKKTLDEVRGEIGQVLAKQSVQKKAARTAAEAILGQVKAGTGLNEAAIASLPGKAPAAPEGGAEDALPEEGAAPAEKSPEPESLVKATGPFTANRPAYDVIPGIGKSPTLAKRLATLTAESPLVDEVLEVDDRFIVARLRERKEPTDAEFATEREKFTNQLKAARSAQLFGNWKAIVFGPVAQREVFRKFAGGALLSGLPKVDGSAIALNAEQLPEPVEPAAPTTAVP